MDIVNFLNNFKINLTGTANSRSDQATWLFFLVAAEKHIGGCIIEIFGLESSEKTTLTLRINAEAQRVGGPGSGRRSSNRPDRQKSPD